MRNNLNLILLVIFIAGAIQTNAIAAQSFTKPDCYFNHLSQVNKEWHDHVKAAPDGIVTFETDIDRIYVHLKLVVRYLTKNQPESLTPQQLRNRTYLVDALNEYAEARIFPVNKYHNTRQPYFVDDYGTHCAVGQLIAVSGHEDLVAAIRKEHNYDYIADIKTNGLQEWADEHGFTINELKWIQPTYPPMTAISPIGTGANGIVTETYYDVYDHRTIFAGTFDELDGLPCLNIGYFKDGQLSCLGNGIDGIIYDLLGDSDGLYVFGGLDDGTTVHPVALYDGMNWSYFSIPGLDSAVCTAVTHGGSGYIAQLAISHSSFPGKQEIWFLTSGGAWEKKAEVDGIVLDAEISSYGRVFVGNFDSLSVYNSGVVDTTFAVHNVVIKSNLTDYWYGIGSEVSDTVKVVKQIGGALFLGGSCSSNPGISDVCLTRYYNGSLQPLFLKASYMGTADFSVNAITYNSGTKFIFGGDFLMDAGMIGTYGNNLASYDLINNWIDPMAIFNGNVNGLAYLGNTLYIGGNFTANMSQPMSYMGRVISYVDVEEADSAQGLSVYPNPFVDVIHVQGAADGTRYTILDMEGRVIQVGELNGVSIGGLDNLPKGIYFFRLELEDTTTTYRLVK